ncbi:conjugal transfer protein [Bacteroides pyogenes]|uniref:conjugal transfer protein n=1 Tax=Bacteroides pyogenes TaxID=310300 RepID=UPI002A839D28|nr:conjugal transfer protein [Bacteroides pyogenes]MDY4249530.1 conjugal transfer protein [Bacteroides pyogenes]
MYRVVFIAFVLYLLWLLLFFGYERSKRKARRKAKRESPTEEVSEAEIIGKSRFQICHSKPQVRSYPQVDSTEKKSSTFATENGNEHSGDTEELPEIDDVPLQYETDGITSREKEAVEVAVPNTEKETYDGGIDFERVQEALSVIHRNASSIVERQRAAETLTELEGTCLMETLRSDTVRSSTIDEIVRSRFEELYVPSEGKGK